MIGTGAVGAHPPSAPRAAPAATPTARSRRPRRRRTRLDLVAAILATVADLAAEEADLLDLKITDTVLAEMTEAFRMFRPYRDRRKLTMFGSARTTGSDPLYIQAMQVARAVASQGWMVVTGAGPGIMAAGVEGAGVERSLGVNIRLPHEQEPNAFLATDPKLVEMRYFFTRKLMLIKESDAYVVLPGGFGTLDEGFELLTLLQTGKAEPAPVVLVEVPGDTYWRSWMRFVEREVVRRGYVSPEDFHLFHLADTVDDAVAHVMGFYVNYHSCRWVGDQLVLRVREVPGKSELERLNRRFAGLLSSGGIRASGPLAPERADEDHLELDRVVLRFDKVHYGDLHRLIWALNGRDGSADLGGRRQRGRGPGRGA